MKIRDLETCLNFNSYRNKEWLYLGKEHLSVLKWVGKWCISFDLRFLSNVLSVHEQQH